MEDNLVNPLFKLSTNSRGGLLKGRYESSLARSRLHTRGIFRPRGRSSTFPALWCLISLTSLLEENINTWQGATQNEPTQRLLIDEISKNPIAIYNKVNYTCLPISIDPCKKSLFLPAFHFYSLSQLTEAYIN